MSVVIVFVRDITEGDLVTGSNIFECSDAEFVAVEEPESVCVASIFDLGHERINKVARVNPSSRRWIHKIARRLKSWLQDRPVVVENLNELA